MKGVNTVTFLQRVVSRFSSLAAEQEEKGMQKYGHEVQPLEPKYDWLRMAEEEFVDGFKYLSAERERRDKLLADALLDVQYVRRTWFISADEEMKNKLLQVEKSIKLVLGI